MFRFILILILLSFWLSVSSFPFYTTTTIEDFEKEEYSNKDIRYPTEESLTKPELSTSNYSSYPGIISNKSLLLKIPSDANKNSFKILLHKPFLMTEWMEKFTFHIKSNQAMGNLYFLLEDSFGRINPYLIASLDFDGWKQFSITPTNISQKDYTLHQPTEIRFIGFLYIPSSQNPSNKENLINIDDVVLVHRKKILLLKN